MATVTAVEIKLPKEKGAKTKNKQYQLVLHLLCNQHLQDTPENCRQLKTRRDSTSLFYPCNCLAPWKDNNNMDADVANTNCFHVDH